MNDKSSRPAVVSKVEDIAQYDLSGKMIVPFATSGMSPIGKSASDMRPSAKGAKVLEGKRFGTSVGEAELKIWAENNR